MENRHGLVVGGSATLATGGTAEREAAPCAARAVAAAPGAGSLWAPTKPTTWPTSWRRYGLDREPVHVTIDGHLSKTGKPRKTSVDRRITRHAGYAISLRCRKRIEEVFGWIKSSAGLAKIKLRGRGRVDAAFTMALAAYNLIRLLQALAAPA